MLAIATVIIVIYMFPKIHARIIAEAVHAYRGRIAELKDTNTQENE